MARLPSLTWCLAGTTLFFAVNTIVVAAEWALEPSASLREEYNDNHRLTTASHPSVWITTLSPSVKGAYRTEISDTAFSANLDLFHYVGESGLDRVDQNYSLNSTFNGERNLLGLSATYTRDSTLLSELSATGVVVPYAHRSNLTLNPSWTWIVNERNSLRLDYNHVDVTYSASGATSGLSDYSLKGTTATWTHLYAERDQLSLSVYDQRFDTTDGNFKSDTIGAQAGWSHEFSETLRGTFMLGKLSTKSTVNSQVCDLTAYPNNIFNYCLVFVPVSQTQHVKRGGASLNARMEKSFESGVLSGTLTREQVPSGNGTLVQTDRFVLAATRQFTETLGFAGDGSVSRSRYVGGAVIGSETRYYSLSPRLIWRISEWWRMEGGYRYQRQDTQTGVAARSSNAVFVTLSYTWPKFALAR